ncbi:MAG: hypothetical protein K6G50_05085, partial [bacterium]|nr:hypothetical protein [bacterium]
MKWIRSVEDSRIIERELDDIKSVGQSQRGGNYGGEPAGYGNYAGGNRGVNFADSGDGSSSAGGVNFADSAGGRYDASRQDSKNSSNVSCFWGMVFFASLALIAGAVFYYLQIYLPEEDYRKANEALRAGKYVTAIRTYEALKDYKNSPQKLSEAKFYALNDSLQKQHYFDAKEYYKRLNPKDYENMRGKEDFLKAIKFSSANMFYRENE